MWKFVFDVGGIDLVVDRKIYESPVVLPQYIDSRCFASVDDLFRYWIGSFILLTQTHHVGTDTLVSDQPLALPMTFAYTLRVGCHAR